MTRPALHHNQPYLACGTTGSDLFLWDMNRGIPLARLQGPAGLTDQLAWAPDGLRLASAARDGALHIWDLSSTLSGTRQKR